MVARTLRATALASACLWPGAAWAEDSDFELGDAPAAETRKPVPVNEMKVGIGYQNQYAGRFGRFTGANQEGGFATGSFRIQDRATGATDGTAYLTVEGDNLDLRNNQALPDASGAVRLGQQGLWGLAVTYDGIPFQQSDNFHTLFGSSGELLNGLTPLSLNATGSNAAGDARVNRFLSATEVGTRRDRLGAKLGYSGVEDWVFSTKLEHEHKQGTKANAMLFVGDNKFAAFAEPVDYNTDRFTASAAYTTRPVQAKLSYTYSSFTNDQSEFDAVSPFIGATHAGYSASQYSLPPSNSEHQVKGQLGLSLTDTTRLTVNTRYGLQLQNEAFKARYYEAPTTAAPLIRDSAYDGMIQNLYGNVALTSRPLKDWDLRAAYTVDDRENSSQTYRLRSYRGDGTSVFNGSGDTRTNVPYSFLNQSADFQLGYRLLKSTKLTLDYLYQDRQRTYAVTSRNQESSVGAKVHSTLADGLTGTLGYARAIRQATAYDGNRGWNEINRTVTAEAELGQYNYAARERDEVKGNLTWGIGPDVSLGANARYINDHFPNSYYGVTDSHIISIGPDATYSPSKTITTHFYYNYQENFINLMGTNATSTVNRTEWNLKNKDSVHTVGASTEWQVTDRFKLVAENNLSYGNTAFEEASWRRGTAASAANYAANNALSLPNSKSVFNALKLSGEYQVYDNVFLGLSALWERFLSKDYLNSETASSTANQAATATVSADGNPSYSVGVLMASTRLVW